MEKTEVRAVIKFFFLKGKTATQIKTKLDAVLTDSSPSLVTVSFWVNEFKRGRTSTSNEPRSGRPKTATTDEMVEKVHKMIKADRRLKVREIVEATGISNDSVYKIATEVLGMRKLSARWVPHLLSSEQKFDRLLCSQENLVLFQDNPKDFVRRLVTVDETWIHYYTPETKEQSKQWTSPCEPAPKKAKVVKSAGKVMATVFWDAQGILFIDYLQKGRTITGEYYAALLERLNDELEKKRPHLAKKKVLFLQDNAKVHTCPAPMAKIHEFRFELWSHPPYSPDLAPCDYHLFPNLKKWLGGKRFYSNNEVIDAANGHFEGLDKSFYKGGIEALEKRWKKCIELKGDYIEK